MPAKNPRLLVTLDPLLYRWIKQIARIHGISMSLALRDIIRKEYGQECWFWTKTWQDAEREADEDLKKGRFKDFNSAEELIKDLKS